MRPYDGERHGKEWRKWVDWRSGHRGRTKLTKRGARPESPRHQARLNHRRYLRRLHRDQERWTTWPSLWYARKPESRLERGLVPWWGV